MRTSTSRPLTRLRTQTRLPKGNVRWAAVKAAMSKSSPLAVLRTITAPLARSGVLAGAALVFLTAVKELPATLLLAPIGWETLATEIWRLTSSGLFERGAVPSLVLLAVSAVPLALLTIRGQSEP